MSYSVGPLESQSQMIFRPVQPFLHRSQQGVPILYNGPPIFCLKIVPSHGRSGPHLMHDFLDPSDSPEPNRSVQLCLQGSLLWQIDRQTTDRPRFSVCNNTPHLASAEMELVSDHDFEWSSMGCCSSGMESQILRCVVVMFTVQGSPEWRCDLW